MSGLAEAGAASRVTAATTGWSGAPASRRPTGAKGEWSGPEGGGPSLARGSLLAQKSRAFCGARLGWFPSSCSRLR